MGVAHFSSVLLVFSQCWVGVYRRNTFWQVPSLLLDSACSTALSLTLEKTRLLSFQSLYVTDAVVLQTHGSGSGLRRRYFYTADHDLLVLQVSISLYWREMIRRVLPPSLNVSHYFDSTCPRIWSYREPLCISLREWVVSRRPNFPLLLHNSASMRHCPPRCWVFESQTQQLKLMSQESTDDCVLRHLHVGVMLHSRWHSHRTWPLQCFRYLCSSWTWNEL